MIIVRERPEAYGLFQKAWATEVESVEAGQELIKDLEAEDKEYGNYRDNYYEVVEL